MIILEEPTIVITYDRDRAMLHQKWAGYTPGINFRNAVDLTFEFMAEKKLYKVLSDITEQKIVSPREQDYTKTAVAKYYNETGSLKIAFVTKPRSIALACVSRYNKTLISEGININNFFDCEEKALTWLLENPEIEPQDVNID